MKRVVIVGGGYAGVTLARALDDAFDVVLVERKDRFFHNVGAMRAYADASLYSRLLIPYDRLLRRGRVEFDEVVSVGTGVVRGGKEWGADVVVVATGSTYGLPFKSSFRESKAFLAEAERSSAELASAEKVAILGDGPVAVELAGEISWRYPNKRLQLVSAGTRLLAGAANPRLGGKILEILRGRGVDVVFGTREVSGADLVIRAFGAGFGAPCLNTEGRVPVDRHFKVPGMEGVFALGDAADCGEAALSFLATRQAAYLGRYLQNPGMAPYKPAKWTAMAVPLGPELGATQLPLPGLPVVGSWLTSRLKGRRLFIEENWRRAGYTTTANTP